MMRLNFIKLHISFRIASILLAALLLSGPFVVNAQTIESLQQADKLRIKVWLEPEQNIIAKQQVKLIIEVASDKKFSSGARVGLFAIKDAIVLQREKFALNFIRQEDNKNWTVQQWTQVVHPQRDGQFVVPAIPVTLSIVGEKTKTIDGQVNTLPMTFEATIPNELEDKDSWIATTRYEVTSSFNKSIHTLKPGDALVRTIHLLADDMPAMMLPKVGVEDVDDIGIYQKPPQISDKVNRGEYLAERIETLTYVFEKTGDYQLPAQSFYWWNLDSGMLETIELPATTLNVSHSPIGVDPADNNQQPSLQNKELDIANLLRKLGIVLIIFIAIWFIAPRLQRYIKNKKTVKPVKLSERSLQRQFNKACRDNDSKKAIQLFYQWLDLYAGESFRGSIRKRLSEIGELQTMSEFNRIMQSIYMSDKNDNVNLCRFANQFIDKLKQLDKSSGLNRWNIELKLN